jgi:hypothetical protein
LAEAYARALWRVLALVSVRGSYAGVLAIAVIVDPDHGPDVDDLTGRLQNELQSIVASPYADERTRVRLGRPPIFP